MKKICLIVLLLLGGALSAQNVTIKAKGKNIEGKQVRLLVMEDYISGLEEKKAEVKLSEGENEFSFPLTLSGVSIATIKIEAFEFGFIVQPGKIYELSIDSIDYAMADSVNMLLYRCLLPIEITNLDKDDVNEKIGRFDVALEDYIAENDKALLVQKDSVVIAGLYKLVESHLENQAPDSYFALYVKYEFGKIQYALRLKSRKLLREELFGDKPIQYFNIGYADCFNHVFRRYFAKGNKYVSQDELEFWLSTNNYDDLSDALGKDKVLKNEVFRELVLIKGMRDAYVDGLYERVDIIKMLEKIASRTKFDQHKTIALNTIELLRQNSYSGLEVKEFEVLDCLGEKQQLKPNIKPLVLNFVKLSEEASKRELEVVNYMYDTIKENCDIITVCCDKSLDAMYNFLKNSKVGSKYKWNFVYFDSNYELLEHYQVDSFPLFILVSPEGRVEQNPMRKPSEGSLSRFVSDTKKQERQQ